MIVKQLLATASLLAALAACNAVQSDEQYYAYRCSEVRGVKAGTPAYDRCIDDERYWLNYNRHSFGGAGP